MRDFAKNPRPALRGAADHDGVNARARQHIAGRFGAVDVAVGHHRYAQQGLDVGHGLVFGLALVTLFAGAAVHREHGNTGFLCGHGQNRRVAR